MAATVLYAKTLEDRGGDERGAKALADAFCRQSRRRISANFRSIFRNDDIATYKVARRYLDGEMQWLERGVISLAGYREFERVADQDPSHDHVEASEAVTAS